MIRGTGVRDFLSFYIKGRFQRILGRQDVECVVHCDALTGAYQRLTGQTGDEQVLIHLQSG